MATICKQLWTEGQTCMETDTSTCHQCVERTSGPKVVVDEDFFSGMGVLWKSCHFSLPGQEVWAAVLFDSIIGSAAISCFPGCVAHRWLRTNWTAPNSMAEWKDMSVSSKFPECKVIYIFSTPETTEGYYFARTITVYTFYCNCMVIT